MTEKFHKRFDPKDQYSNYDHIIIGSGIGGLTAAVWLAKAGQKVLILEKHYKPGGLTHSFKRKKGYQWDVGVHYVGNVGKNEPLHDMFNFLTNNELEWASLGEVYDVVHIENDTYEFLKGKENQQKKLINYFPQEQQAIETYFKLIEKVNKLGTAFFLEKSFEPWLSFMFGWLIRKLFHQYSNKTTQEVLESLTQDKRLIAVLCAQCGNYGLAPNKSSFAAHAMVIGHFLNGGYYPKGGSEKINEKMLKLLDSLGSSIIVKAGVDEIVVKNNKVQGVQVENTFIACKSVISAIGVNNTFNYLLDEKARQRNKFSLNKIKPSSGHLCLYVGLNKSDKALNLPKHNVWCFKNDDLDACINNATIKNAANQFAYISFPSAKDPIWQKENPNKATIQALSVGKFEWFEKYKDLKTMKRGEDYEALKKQFEETMLQKLYDLFPQIKGCVEIVEVSSPLSTAHFANYKNGEIYGLEHTPERFQLPFLRAKTKIKGLRLAGQDLTLVGVAGAMASGMLSAITILKFKSLKVFKMIGKD